MRFVVYHGGYGCDTGCCGHYVAGFEGELPAAIPGDPTPYASGYLRQGFVFDHPAGDFREFAEGLLAETFGAEHIADLDWEHCLIVDD